MKSIYLSIAFLFPLVSFCTTNSSAFNGVPGQIYSIGDELPNLKFDHLVNSAKSSISLNELRGKLVILDFWGLWCPPCLRVLPKLDSLQRLYGNQLSIIPIDGTQGGDNSHKVLSYLKSHGFILPSVVEDSILIKMFPHKIVPHDVWIDKNGKVIATTDASEVNDKNIQTILSGGRFTGKMKSDIVGFNINEPLFVKGNAGQCDSFLFRSLLTTRIIGISGSSRQIPLSKGGRLYIRSFQTINTPGLMLFAKVLDAGKSDGVLRPSRIFLRKNGTLYNPNDFTQQKSIWRTFPRYCYSLDIPEEVPDSLFYRKYVLEDLNRYFKTDARIEKKIIPTLIFRLNFAKWDSIGKNAIKDTGRKNVIYSNIEHDYLDSVVNMPFQNLIDFLSEFYIGSEPLIDETGLDLTRVSLGLHVKFSLDEADRLRINLPEWQAAFGAYGISVSIEDRLTDVLVLNDVWTDNQN